MGNDRKTTATRRDILRLTGSAAAASAFGAVPVLRGERGAAARPLGQTTSTGATPVTGAATTNGDWPTFGYDYQQTRHVPFDQITKENISDLGLAWSFDFQAVDPEIPGGNETFPLVVDGVLYATTSYNHVFALDAKTGEEIWHWAPEEIGFFKNFGLNVNRGVAFGDGRVYMLTLDMRIIMLDAKSGDMLAEVNIGDTVPDALPEFGYYQTAAPIYYGGNLYIGSSGSDNGVRGFFMAYKGADLSPAWPDPFWTIPPEGQDWRKDGANHGGGAPWMPGTLDPDTNTLYYVTGNPSPDYFGATRPGNNPNTNSIIAVDATSGEQRWVAQSISRDLWDYDMAAPPVLMTATVGGAPRKVVAEGSKAGQWWCWDAETGEVIYDGVPFARIDHPEPTAEGVLVYPGITGGSNYAPQSYDASTNYYLIANVESPVLATLGTAEQVERRARGDVDFGATFEFPQDINPYGTYVAIDMEDGEVVYSREVPGPLRGGFTTTATGLGFFGGTEEDPNLHAIDTTTGDIIWSFGVGESIFAAPTIYMVDGEQYVAVAVGGGSTGTASRIETFKLGGEPSELAAPVAEAPAAAPAPTEPAEFLTLSPARNNSVVFNCVAAFDNENNTFNFNGYASGDLTITLPVGWIFDVQLWNLDARNPHSLMITTEAELARGRDFVAAFLGAYTPEPEAGFVGDQIQRFTALGGVEIAEPGTYVMLCAVPGHAAQGMWDTLIVDPNATVPTLTTVDGVTIELSPETE